MAVSTLPPVASSSNAPADFGVTAYRAVYNMYYFRYIGYILVHSPTSALEPLPTPKSLSAQTVIQRAPALTSLIPMLSYRSTTRIGRTACTRDI